MARKQRDTTDVYFDTRTKAVLTRTSHNSMANVKEQLAGVREVVPHRKKEDILLVLQHFDNDVPKTIQAFMEDRAEEILKEWNIPNKRKTNNNKNKKKRSKQQQSANQEDGLPIANGLQEEHIPNNNNIDKPIEAGSTQQTKPIGAVANDAKPAPAQRQSAPKPVDSPKPQRNPQQTNSDRKPAPTQSKPKENPAGATQKKPQEPRQRPAHAQSQQGQHPSEATQARSGQQHSHKQASGPAPDRRTGKDGSGQRSGQGQSSEGVGKRERNISESSSVTDPSRSKKTGSSLDKSSKDLQRTVVSLTRHKNLLAEEIEKAEKRLKKSFDDARTSLGSREEELMRQIQEVKRQATSLLDDRQHRAFELKQEISRAVSKTDTDLLELRADIKHFVSERKIDEEIGRSSRFTGNPDLLQEAVKNFGEVLPVKSVYSARRHSLTSLTSMDSLSRPTSISDDHGGLLSRSASTVDTPATPTSPTTPDADMDSEVAKMAAKMQRSLQGQRGRGPRNPRQGSDRQGQQGSNPRQGQSQSAKEGSRQDQRGNRGRQDGPNKHSPRSADDKSHHEASQEGRRNDRPRNDRPRNDRPRNDRQRYDRGEGGRGKDREEPRNKDRIIRRREQYRWRHDQGEVKPEGGVDKDTKNESGAVPRPDSIQISQNGPVNSNKKLEGAVNGDLPMANGNSHDSKADSPKLKEQPQGKSGDQTKADLNGPLVNGNASSSAETTPTEALPQRKPREERNRKRVEEVVREVVKEVTAMNGMTNGQVSPIMVNGES
ncbi:spermatogenesis-associated serine-rich protein 2-like isoform X2 [Patiria miniata]|uniref:Spermatogenesis-associated serine-rich protein 2-like n=1 Tax=Patiria miniata TaxID=46514 RepID=A0A914B677_PATMI|nr:spermatogenesis-associated serine-rich protein 2-like isoform X2 [Patiria miniata]